jgi:tripartite-type tricarboxylate transporter receptor subunit TctC
MTARRVAACLVALALALHAAAALAQAAYPTRPLRLIVGFTPGGGVDINARLLASKLAEYLGQPTVVENRPGAGTNIANELVAKAAPDGYTLLFTSSAVAINMALYRKLAFDTLRDFAPVAIFSESPNLLVVSSRTSARDVAELLAAARAKPGTMNYSSAGTGTTQHMAGELFKLRTRTDIVHVPFKGSAPSITALIAGDVDMTFVNIPAIIQQVRAGRLRPLAYAAPRRSDALPDIPTLQEVGVSGADVSVWYGLLAPAGTPREIVAALAAAVGRAARAPDMRQRLLDQGADPVGNSPEAFAQLLREEVARWKEVVAATGIQAD